MIVKFNWNFDHIINYMHKEKIYGIQFDIIGRLKRACLVILDRPPTAGRFFKL